MPSLSEEQIEEINYYLNKSIDKDISLKIKYISNNKITTYKGHIIKINQNQNYIILEDNIKIKFKEIISIST